MALSRQLRERVRKVARELYEEVRREEGGRSLLEKNFVTLEDEATELSDELMREVMELVLADQAQQAAATETICCSACGRPVEQHADDDIEPRIVQTRRGDVAWREPKYYCLPCRRDFFPSVPGSGD